MSHCDFPDDCKTKLKRVFGAVSVLCVVLMNVNCKDFNAYVQIREEDIKNVLRSRQ